MSEEIKQEKKKIKDTRKHLSDKFIRGLKEPGSVGDDEVIGLRIHVNEGGTYTFRYHYSDKNDGKKRYKEKIGMFPNVNTVQARNEAKVIAVRVMQGVSSSQIKRERRTEKNTKELMEEYVKARLKTPKYKPSTQQRWKAFNNAWIYGTTKDPVIRKMFAASKIDIGGKKLSQVNMENLREFHKFVGSKSESAANTLIEMLSVIFNYAVERKYIATNPVKFKTEDLFERKEDNRRFTRKQMDTILDFVLKYDGRSKDNPRLNLDYYKSKKLSPVACCIIAYALLTPRRYRSEGACIKWDQISFHEKKLFCSESKVGQKEYDLGPKVLKLLKAIRNERFNADSPFVYNDERSLFVFPSRNFGKINNVGKLNEKPYVYNLRRTWKTIIKSLKLNYIPAYNCRHSYLTDGLSKTKNIALVGKLAGHSPKSKSTMRYAKILNEDVVEALQLIDKEEAVESKVLTFSK